MICSSSVAITQRNRRTDSCCGARVSEISYQFHGGRTVRPGFRARLSKEVTLAPWYCRDFRVAPLAVRWSSYLNSSRRSRNSEDVDLFDQHPGRDSQSNNANRPRAHTLCGDTIDAFHLPENDSGKFQPQSSRRYAVFLGRESRLKMRELLLTNRVRAVGPQSREHAQLRHRKNLNGNRVNS